MTKKMMANRILAFLLAAALTIGSANALTPARAEQTSSAAPGTKTGHNEALAHEITQLFNEDQTMISDLEKARRTLRSRRPTNRMLSVSKFSSTPELLYSGTL